MKFLYIAFECDPYRGSEAYCGWSWVRVMKEYHEVHVITRPECRKNIEKYIEENNVTNLNVYYCEVPLAKRLTLAKGYHFMLYFTLWTKKVYSIVKELHEKEKFDYIHQVTLGDFRFIGKCWRLDTKFVFGPVGGGQITPKVFSPYTKDNWKNERFREFINYSTLIKPSYKKAINHAYRIYSANEETKMLIDKVLKDKSKNILLTENGVNVDAFNRCKERQLEKKDKVVILWSGRIIYRKGLKFLLEILKMIEPQTPYEVWLYGTGGQQGELQQYVRQNGLQDIVFFKGKVSYAEMQLGYENADIFVFPSLRETTGTVLFEAMMNKLAIIMFRQNGGKLLLEENCGVLVNVDGSLEDIKRDFAKQLERLIDDYEWRTELTNNAMIKMQRELTWEAKISHIVW